MTTLGQQTPGEDTFAADPSIMSTEVPDYSSVPPAVDYTPVETDSDANPSAVPNASTADPRKWDYGQKVGGKFGADFNMEAPISAEDVIRAGGLGARDELDSFLPSAVDATDFEESLKDAMEYEDVQPEREGDIPRPGVGFVNDQQQQIDGSLVKQQR